MTNMVKMMKYDLNEMYNEIIRQHRLVMDDVKNFFNDSPGLEIQLDLMWIEHLYNVKQVREEMFICSLVGDKTEEIFRDHADRILDELILKITSQPKDKK